MNEEKPKLLDLLKFFSVNNRYMSFVIPLKDCKCGKPAVKMVFDYRFTDSFKLDYKVRYYCEECIELEKLFYLK